MMNVFVRGVYAEFGRWQGEDQPSFAGVDRRNSRISLKKLRRASASVLYISAWTPVITMSPRRRVAGLLAGSANKLYSTLLYHRAPRRSRAPSKVAISAEAEYTLFCIKSCHQLEAAYGA